MRGDEMPRRTVTVPPGFDKTIRSLQARLIQSLNRDVTYTEALNVVLFHGFLRPWSDGKTVAFWREGDEEATAQEVLQLKHDYNSNEIRFDGLLDAMGPDPDGEEKPVSLDPKDAVPGWMVGEDDF